MATNSSDTSGDVLITFTQNTVVQLIKNVKIYKELKIALVKCVLFTYNSLLWLHYIIIFFKSFVFFFFPKKVFQDSLMTVALLSLI